MKFVMVIKPPTPLEEITNQEGKAKCLKEEGKDKCLKEEVNMGNKASSDNNHRGVIRDNKVTHLLPLSSIKSWVTANATKTFIALNKNSVS